MQSCNLQPEEVRSFKFCIIVKESVQMIVQYWLCFQRPNHIIKSSFKQVDNALTQAQQWSNDPPAWRGCSDLMDALLSPVVCTLTDCSGLPTECYHTALIHFQTLHCTLYDSDAVVEFRNSLLSFSCKMHCRNQWSNNKII